MVLSPLRLSVCVVRTGGVCVAVVYVCAMFTFTAEPEEPKLEQKEKAKPLGVLVSNIRYEAKVHDIRAIFKECGRIVDFVIPKGKADKGLPNMGKDQHRGLVYLEFDTDDALQKALKLDNTAFSGRPIRVRQADHAPNQGREEKGAVKVRMCEYFAQGRCHRGDMCGFAHHPRELGQPRPKVSKVVDGGQVWS